uniref:Putative secreted protein with chitin-binding domain type 2 n=1 Tax=Panstrongylus lignarius TaxID=156445 RepID=A0A224XSP6_9HEMI
MIKLGLLLVSVFAIVLAHECAENVADYNWPDNSNCRYYYHCHNGKASRHSCFALFRNFNPATRRCDWLWKVKCADGSNLFS